MHIRLALASAVVFAAAVLLLPGSVWAQFAAQVKVSDVVEPGLGGSPLAGVSVARCGNSVVVGFSDTEQGNNNSFAGLAVSSNGGNTFRDLGVLPVSPMKFPVGPDVLGYGGAGAAVFAGSYDASLGCSSSNIFYYASILTTGNPPCTDIQGCSAISVSASSNGGSNWGLPVVLTAASLGTDQFFFPSLAVDPTNPRRVYVSYVNWNINAGNFGVPYCQNSSGMFELYLAHSADGGKTWANNLVDHACTDTTNNPEELGALLSPKVAVSPGGKVYIVYEFRGYNGLPKPNEIRFTRSVDEGQIFSVPLVVSRDAVDNALPQLAVDRTGLRSRGEIYLTWAGKPTRTYTDVLVSDSVNFGLSFSFPRPISPAPAAGTGRFQTNPVVAVDNDGLVATCFYETPHNQPTSSSVYSYNCAGSFNHGASWQQQRIASSVPVGFDALTADFLLHNDGFFSAYEISSNGKRSVVGRSGDAN